MKDGTSKVLLAVIALGIWANAILIVLTPSSSVAQISALSSISSYVAAIYKGTCPNHKICHKVASPAG
jgi:hypothetical protein